MNRRFCCGLYDVHVLLSATVLSVSDHPSALFFPLISSLLPDLTSIFTFIGYLDIDALAGDEEYTVTVRTHVTRGSRHLYRTTGCGGTVESKEVSRR